MVLVVLFIIAKCGVTQMFISRLDKQNVVHPFSETIFSHGKEQNTTAWHNIGKS